MIPYRIQMEYVFAPISNAAIIGITSAFYFLTSFSVIPESVVESMVLQGWSLDGMFGCILLHGGLFHLIGNMLFLWVFGNAINSVVGNIWYVPVYLFLGLCASATHLMFSGGPAIGASGAINGIVGMSLVLFPTNKLETMNFFWSVGAVRFVFRLYTIVLLWFLFDLLGALSGAGDIGYWAHIGGFLSGVAMGALLLAFNKTVSFDRTLFDILSGSNDQGRERSYISADENYEERLLKKVDSLRNDLYPDMKGVVFDPLTQSYSSVDEFGLPVKLRDPNLKPNSPEPDETPKPEIAVPPPQEQAAVLPEQDEPLDEIMPLPAVSIRVLRIMRESKLITCFFVNEGEEIMELSVDNPSALSGEIYPGKVLKKKEPGWLKFGFEEGCVPGRISFILKCKDANGKTARGLLMIDEDAKRISSE